LNKGERKEKEKLYLVIYVYYDYDDSQLYQESFIYKKI